MARTHGRIDLAIWADEDWAELPLPAQWLYLALISQPEINHAGVLSLAVKRWAAMAAGLDTGTVEKALEFLADRRYVVIDWDAELVLVRSFMRNDGVAKQPNTLKGACAAIRLVRSPIIRAALLVELRRLDAAKIQAMRPSRADHEPPYVVYMATIAALSGHPEPDPNHPSVSPSDGYASEGNAPDPNPRTRGGEGVGEGEGVRSLSVGGSGGGGRASTRDPNRCDTHAQLPPDTWVPPCGACAARRTASAHAATRADHDARAARAHAADLCRATGRCDGLWLLEYPDGPPVEPATKCHHPPPRLYAVPS